MEQTVRIVDRQYANRQYADTRASRMSDEAGTTYPTSARSLPHGRDGDYNRLTMSTARRAAVSAYSEMSNSLNTS